MNRQDWYWQVFALSGDPDAYMRYRRNNPDSNRPKRLRADNNEPAL